jgi:hypothetical protein
MGQRTIVSKGNEFFMDLAFPQNRAACHYYPGSHNDCSYISVCHGTDEEKENPLENGYVLRTPHHKAELIQIEGKENNGSN